MLMHERGFMENKMEERTKLGLRILEAALLLGVVGNVMLRVTPWGINATLAVVALAAAMIALLRQRRSANLLSSGGRLLIGFVCLFALLFAWRDSGVLKFLNATSIIGALALIAFDANTGRVRVAGLSSYLLGALLAAFNAAFGGLQLLLSDIKWAQIPRARWSKQAAAIARGLFIAVPLVLVFGGLFMAADAIFNDLVSRSFPFDVDVIVSHVVLTLFFAWLAAGFLGGAVLGNWLVTTSLTASGFQTPDIAGESVTARPENSVTANESKANESKASESETNQTRAANATDGKQVQNEASASAKPASEPARRFFSLGITEIGIVLGLLNALFFSFVLVQMRYLFGGGAHVVSSAGLTYAEYARRGFFELVWVAALALPMLLAAHWLLRKDNPAHERIFRALAGTLVALLFVVMLSAIQRMRLYQSEYGLTELRLYTTAFMLWLGIVFVWFVITILTNRARREQFAFGAVIAAFVIIAGLHFINPDALIVRTNAGRVASHRSFDDDYAVTLSADAVPALVEALPSMDERGRCDVARRLLEEWPPAERADWRTWSVSRLQAWQATREHEAILRQFNCTATGEATATERTQ